MRRLRELTPWLEESSLLREVIELEGETDPDLRAEAIWSIGLRLRAGGREERAALLWRAFTGETKPSPATEKIRRELALLEARGGDFGGAFERRLSQILLAATDPATILPMALAASLGGLARLRGFAGLCGRAPHWITRGPMAGVLSEGAGLVAESSVFTFAQHGLRALGGEGASTSPFFRDLGGSALALGVFRVSRRGPLPPAAAGVLGLSLVAKAEAALGWKPEAPWGETLLQSAAGLISLQAGLGAARALFPSLALIQARSETMLRHLPPGPSGAFAPASAYAYVGKFPSGAAPLSLDRWLCEPLKMSRFEEEGGSRHRSSALIPLEDPKGLSERLAAKPRLVAPSEEALLEHESVVFLSKESLTQLEKADVLTHRQASLLKSAAAGLSSVAGEPTARQRKAFAGLHARFFLFLRTNFEQAKAKGATQATDEAHFIAEKTLGKEISLRGLYWQESSATLRLVKGAASPDETLATVHSLPNGEVSRVTTPALSLSEHAREFVQKDLAGELASAIRDFSPLYAALRREIVPVRLHFSEGGRLELITSNPENAMTRPGWKVPMTFPGKISVEAKLSPSGALLEYAQRSASSAHGKTLREWFESPENRGLSQRSQGDIYLRRFLDTEWQRRVLEDVGEGLETARAAMSNPKAPFRSAFDVFPQSEGFTLLKGGSPKGGLPPVARIVVAATPPKRPDSEAVTRLGYEIKEGILPDRVAEVLEFLRYYEWRNP